MFRAFLAVFLLTATSAQAQQTIRVGIQDSEPGLVQNNPQMRGHLVELWDAIGKEAGLKVVHVIMDNNPALLKAMDDGKLDVVAGATRTNETAAKYSLSDGYASTEEALVIRQSDARAYNSVADIKTLRVGTLKDSAYDEHLKQNGATAIRYFATTADVMKAVSNGEADVALFAGGISGYALKLGQFPDLKIASGYKAALGRPNVMVFPKTGSEFLEKTNAALKKLSADGTLKAIRARYGLN